ncbi:Protein of unknown function [Cotesia congregata]|uniref:MIT domain-containing protein n=1 Tax=Cotesia congregata TaxID=51543 RepID=A0A8J2MKX6_COTCN|nr:Protein of unknown function [Cotesia congregata]
MDPNFEDAKKAASKAIKYDSEKQFEKALCWYEVTIKFLHKLLTHTNVSSKLNEYQDRIKVLKALGREEKIQVCLTTLHSAKTAYSINFYDAFNVHGIDGIGVKNILGISGPID